MSSSIFNYDVNKASNKLTSSQAHIRTYPDPFLTYSTMLMPKSTDELFKWCEAVWVHNGSYARAMQRVVAFFITKIVVSNCSTEEGKKYEDFLNKELNVPVVLSKIGMDFMAYGNSLSSIYIPFRRFLACEHKHKGKACSTQVPIDDLDYEFKNGKFIWHCPNCKKKVISDKPIDRRTKDESQIRIKRWSPSEIKIKLHPISGDKVFLWEPSADIKTAVNKGDKFMLRYLPWEMVESIVKNKLFEFNPRVIFHMCEETLAGFNTGGWGISQLLTNFRQAYYVQMAKMYNEVLMQEYIIPFRAVSPARTAGNAAVDPLIGANVGNVNSKLLDMLNRHRSNPGGYYALPFPIEYQALSGEGATMQTYDHIDRAMDELLNAAGVPAEFYKGTINFQALPTALRLFKQTWPHLKAYFDKWLEWLMATLSELFNWDKATAELLDNTLADDIERRHFLMQLMSSQSISKETALSPLGIDASEELRKIMEEQREQIAVQSEFDRQVQHKQLMQENMMMGGAAAAQAAAGGSGGGGMMPAGGGATGPMMGGATGTTMEDMAIQAEQQAAQLLQMPYEQRRSEMLNIKKTNSTLHAIVKQKMEEMRNQAQTMGGQQMLQSGQIPPPQ